MHELSEGFISIGTAAPVVVASTFIFSAGSAKSKEMANIIQKKFWITSALCALVFLSVAYYTIKLRSTLTGYSIVFPRWTEILKEARPNETVFVTLDTTNAFRGMSQAVYVNLSLSQPWPDIKKQFADTSERTHSLPPSSTTVHNTGDRYHFSVANSLPIKYTTDGNALNSFMSDYILQPQTSTQKSRRELPIKTIFFYNIPVWLSIHTKYFTDCDFDACAITNEAGMLQKADGVLYHLPELGGNPPLQRPMGQVWIAFGLEAPFLFSNTHKSPSWRSVFNWTMTYRLDSDIRFLYGSLILHQEIVVKNYTDIALKKTKSAAWLVSNCRTQSQRDKYVQNMMKHNMSVDIYGRCGSLHCARNKESECMGVLNTTYRFYLSFENAFCQDYVTEKFFKLFDNVDAVPVVRGGANYKKYFPPGTFIDTADFKTAEELVKHLKNLETNIDAYARILRLKDQYRTRIINPWCALCKKLHTDKNVKSYPDFSKWLWDNTCHEPNDF